MKKLICARGMAVDGSFIYPGTYEVETIGNDFLVKNAQGNHNVNLIMSEAEINSCGYLI